MSRTIEVKITGSVIKVYDRLILRGFLYHPKYKKWGVEAYNEKTGMYHYFIIEPKDGEKGIFHITNPASLLDMAIEEKWWEKEDDC